MDNIWRTSETRPGGIFGNFTLPGLDNKIPDGFVRCNVCNMLVERGMLTMAQHDGRCGSKELLEKMMLIGDKFKEGQISEEQAMVELRKTVLGDNDSNQDDDWQHLQDSVF